MRHYEVVLLVHPDQSDEVSGIVGRLRAGIERDGGVIHRLEDWGRRQLTYPIAKVHKAHYVLMNIEVSGEALTSFRDALKYNDAVIRNMILARNEAETERSKLYEEELAAQKAEEDRERRRKQELEERQRAREAAAKSEAEADNGSADESSVSESNEPAVEPEPQAATEAPAAEESAEAEPEPVVEQEVVAEADSSEAKEETEASAEDPQEAEKEKEGA